MGGRGGLGIEAGDFEIGDVVADHRGPSVVVLEAEVDVPKGNGFGVANEKSICRQDPEHPATGVSVGPFGDLAERLPLVKESVGAAKCLEENRACVADELDALDGGKSRPVSRETCLKLALALQSTCTMGLRVCRGLGRSVSVGCELHYCPGRLGWDCGLGLKITHRWRGGYASV